ncbi:MAG: hypothetical protein AB7K52_15165 [Phycisphaerales bacterium]
MPVVKTIEPPAEQPPAGARAPRNGADHPGREVFLSPRVVDREAFNDLAGTLRALIDQAAGETAALKLAHEQAGAAVMSLRDVAGKHTARFEAAARATAGLDERAARVEQLLGAVQQAAATLAEARAQTQRLTADLSEGLARRAEALGADLAARFDAASAACEARAARAEAQAAAAEQRCEELARRLELFTTTADTRLAEARQTISGYEARGVRSLEDAATHARRSFDGVCELLSRHGEELRLSLAAAAGQQRDALERSVTAALARATDAAASLTRSADAAESRVAEALSRAETDLDERRQHLADMLIRAEEAAGEVEALVGLSTALPEEEDAEAAIESQGLALPGSLADFILRARAARRAAEETLARFGRADQTLEKVRGELDAELESRRADVGELLARLDRARAELADGLRTADDAGRALRDGRAEIDRMIREPLAAVENKTAELRAHTTSLDTHVRRARDVADQAVARTAQLVSGLSGLLTELKPWAGLLGHDRPAGEDLPEGAARPIPPVLRPMIDEIRAEIAGDLAAIASGLKQIGIRAGQPGARPHA